MREYEMVYILHPQFPESKMEQLNNKLKAIIEKYDGTLFYTKSLGKRKLAYPIKKQIKGEYYLLRYAAVGNCVREIESSFRIDENILRFLTVLKSEKIDVAVRLSEIEARGEALTLAEEATLNSEAASKEIAGEEVANKKEEINE